MRVLTLDEIAMVAGGDDCSSEDGGGSGNNIGGVTDSGSIGQDLTNIYEGLVEVTSHIIERVAQALD